MPRAGGAGRSWGALPRLARREGVPPMLSIHQQTVAARAYVDDALQAGGAPPDETFSERLRLHFPRLFTLFADLYGQREDCLDQLAALLALAGRSWQERPGDLK